MNCAALRQGRKARKGEALRAFLRVPGDLGVRKTGSAGRPLAEGLRCLGLQTKDLPLLKKGDPRKAALAVRIRPKTTAPTAWIAEQLHLGHVSRVNQCAHAAPPDLLR